MKPRIEVEQPGGFALAHPSIALGEHLLDFRDQLLRAVLGSETGVQAFQGGADLHHLACGRLFERSDHRAIPVIGAFFCSAERPETA